MLDTATDINKRLNTVPDDDFEADTDLGDEKIFYNNLIDCNNDSLYIAIVPTYLKNLLFPRLLMKMLLIKFLNFTPCAKNHVCTHGTAACTYSCTE